MFKCPRIRLQCNFNVSIEFQAVLYALQQVFLGCGGEQAWSTPAQEYGHQSSIAGFNTKIVIQVSNQRIDILLLVQFPFQGVGVKVAVRTFRNAPRKMYVQGEGRELQVRR
jgi:hypothetical protein